MVNNLWEAYNCSGSQEMLSPPHRNRRFITIQKVSATGPYPKPNFSYIYDYIFSGCWI